MSDYGRGRLTQNASTPSKNIKKVKPIGAGKAFALGVLASLIVIGLASILLVGIALTRTASEQAQYSATLDDAVSEVRDASSAISLALPESIREQCLSSSVAISYDDNGTAKQCGSGIVMKDDGTILVNYHCVNGKNGLKAIVSGKTYDADIIGQDPSSDLAVIKVDAKDLSAAQIGQSSEVHEGDYAIITGCLLGMNGTLTSDPVSGLDRDMMGQIGRDETIYSHLIQLDDPIGDGMSGAGLYDSNGKLIGVCVAPSSDSAKTGSVGYAIPIDIALPIATNMMNGETPAHPSLGVTTSDVPDDEISKYGLSDSSGAYVENVTPSGPAETCGIVSGDIITELDGEKVSTSQDLLYKTRASKINGTVKIKILREGKEMEFNIKIGSDA